MFKCLNILAASYLFDSLTYFSHNQSYTTRKVIKNHLFVIIIYLSLKKVLNILALPFGTPFLLT